MNGKKYDQELKKYLSMVTNYDVNFQNLHTTLDLIQGSCANSIVGSNNALNIKLA